MGQLDSVNFSQHLITSSTHLNCGVLSGVRRPEFITGVVISVSSEVIRSPTVGFGGVYVSKTNRRSIFYFIV
ncbi:hypothetical protein HanIR_Chr17g0848721 [Helianthus annuus]|nr:hypothetical protein HanIR_Chr17g0848721 [Helianthus annuus]